MLTRLVYASETVPTTTISVVQQIVDGARVANERKQLTGMLAFDSKCFLQVLEGSREAVSAAFGAIARDPRHQRVQLLECVTTDERLFGAWGMGFAAAHNTGREIFLRFSEADRFEPAKMTAAAALGLLRSLPTH